MDSSPRTASALTNRGIDAERAGQRDEARANFAAALHLDPEYELAWLWYASVIDDPGERRYCLNRALAINPDSAGRRVWARLAGVPPVVPPELADLAEPPLPPSLTEQTPPGRLRASLRPTGERPSVSHPRLDQARARLRSLRRRREAQAADARSRRNRLLTAIAGVLLAVAIVASLFAWLRPNRDVAYVAFVGALSGPYSFGGQEAADAVRLYLEQVNGNGGVDGRELQLLVYDDQDDPDLARQRAAEIVADGRPLVVIGHDTSDASIAAADTYQAAGIPAITGGATAENVTADRPWYFRTVFTNSSQGQLLALYVERILGLRTASFVYGKDDYGQSLFNGFDEAFRQQGGTVKHAWPFDPAQHDATIQQVVADLAADTDPGIVVFALADTDARDLIVAIRDHGLNPPMIGGDVLGTEQFARLFAAYPNEQAQPGHYTDGLYAVSPFLYDGAGGPAVTFRDRFHDRFGYEPDGWAVKSYDAATAAVQAIDVANVGGTPVSAAADRQRIRDRLAALNSLQTAIPSLDGPLYFDQTNSMPQPIWIGRFEGGDFAAAPVQYLPVIDPYRYNLDQELANGTMSKIGDLYFSPTRVVYTGVDINEISDLDTANQTYAADFFLWFRYAGDDDATDVRFANAVDPNLGLGDPIESGTVGDLNYRVYRVRGEFKERLDFHDYPWDRHQLPIRLQNATLRADHIVYVADQIVLDQPQAERLFSGVDASRTINGIPNWHAEDVEFYQDTVSSDSALGDPRLSNAAGAVAFSQFVTDITIARDVRSFLIKNLLPLALLALVTYISLYLPPEQAGTRIGFAITSILTSAVLLGSVSSQLPEIGYTVAIEWGFYVYIALSAVLVIINMVVDRLTKRKHQMAAHRLDIFERILYPVVVLGVIAVYAVTFSRSG